MAKENQQLLLKMDGISKAFAGVQVLTDVSFDLYAGEVHVLAGENGAGKTTLMKILAGVHIDYEGQISINGQSVRFNSVHDAAAKGISVIHQELSLVGTMNVAENIFLAKEKSVVGWLCQNAMIKQSRELLQSLGLEIDVEKYVADYPLSIQQMIEIAKAIAFDCRIIVMDEPTSALTKPEVEKLFGIISQLKSRGCGIIYITHKMEEIYRIADRITVLRDGAYIGTAEAAELPQNKLVQWMVGRELNQQFPRHLTNLGSVRLQVENFTVPDPSGKPVPAVNNVSFSVRAGEILGIAGLSGSGSSELLNGIFGTYGRKVTGSIKIDGQSFKTASPRKSIEHKISLSTKDRQATGLVTEMSIVHNVTLAALKKFSPCLWLRPKQELHRTQNQMQSLRLKAASPFQPVKSLSGGTQQKVVIAKWIETQPKIMLLDEPTRGIDVGAKHEIYELMNKWTSEGIAIVLITSEMPELLAMSDRIVVMHRGKITAEFSGNEATQEKILKAAMGEEMQN